MPTPTKDLTLVSVDSALLEATSEPRDLTKWSQEWREDYVRWFVDTLMTANLRLAQERKLPNSKEYRGPRTFGEVNALTGPHGMMPEESTIWRWLRSDWAKAIIAQVASEIERVCDVQTDAEWPMIMANMRMLAMTGQNRDAVQAAKFVDEVRRRREVAPESGLAKKIGELIGSGKFDGEVEVRERIFRLRKAQADATKTVTIEAETVRNATETARPDPKLALPGNAD